MKKNESKKKNESFFSNLGEFFDYNPSTSSGLIDIMVSQDKNKIFKSTNFHFRFGKFRIFKPKDTEINLYINNIESSFKMRMSKKGIAYFKYFINRDKNDHIDSTDFNSDFQSEEEKKDDNIKEGNFSKKKESQNDYDKKYSLKNKKNFKEDKKESFENIEEKEKTKSEKKNNSEKNIDLKNENNIVNIVENPDVQKNIVENPELQKNIEKDVNKKNDEEEETSEQKIINKESKEYLETEELEKEENQIELSLCSQLISPEMSEKEIKEIFNTKKINYSQFNENPHLILGDENLMIKIGKKFYEPYIGIPQIISLLAFNKDLTPNSLSKMVKDFEEFEIKPEIEIPEIKDENKKIKKSLRPPQEFWQELDLKEGINELILTFKGNLGSINSLKTRIFYYPYKPYRRIIISDIDGTITRSDLLGHIMPFLNRDWEHDGIAKFFQNLYNRNYTIVYLTARNIGQSYKTLNYLKSISQNDVKLPNGPLFTHPGSFLDSVKREIIKKNPHEHKIKVLKEIKDIFSNDDDDYNPLYAGFGNKFSDSLAYSAVGINKDRNYIINPDGKMFTFNSQTNFTYEELNDLIHEFYPEYNPEKYFDDNYGESVYWKNDYAKNLDGDVQDLFK